MGACLGKRKTSALMIGLDNAGKTTILAHLADVAHANRGLLLAEVFTVPTVGVESVTFTTSTERWQVWDAGGQGRYRKMWPYYADHAPGIVFVVDVTDAERIAVAREEFFAILDHPSVAKRRVPLLVLANKTDVKGDVEQLTLDNVRQALGLQQVEQQRGHPVKLQS
mmetsp:Transcript_44736/g.140280  ORF Transcript_44736/g.140280 Transcript_44736/m.140280 type:complete len:167 (-) Transcript_44736:16-516(-)